MPDLLLTICQLQCIVCMKVSREKILWCYENCRSFNIHITEYKKAECLLTFAILYGKNVGGKNLSQFGKITSNSPKVSYFSHSFHRIAYSFTITCMSVSASKASFVYH